MCIAIEGPQLTAVNFHQILDIYKKKFQNTIINHSHRIPLISKYFNYFMEFWGGGGGGRNPLYETLPTLKDQSHLQPGCQMQRSEH